ncbi:YeiH family protein [Hirschia litorea]|uniref:YeiH family protein n=1 Tax=Hirschia litorea TaxID=1199156 RepID=A0ABW2IP44_9PROT
MSTISARSSAYVSKMKSFLPGLLLASLVAMAAQFMAEHTGAPSMLMALLFGMALSSVHENGSVLSSGIMFSAKSILKFGVVLLGARISVDVLVSLGWEMVVLLLLAVATTIFVGFSVRKLFGKSAAFAVLTAGAVSICGASAALAIAAVLPKTKESEKDLLFTVLSVTLLSTLAMVFYPVLLRLMHFDDIRAGAFIGATVHDVAQVVGAGFSISNEAGEIATLVKLIRVTFLAPVVIVLSLLFRKSVAESGETSKPVLIPAFVIGFLCLAVLNSFGLLSEPIREIASVVSKWSLLIAISAVGIKTSLLDIIKVGYSAIALVVAQTVFLALIILFGLQFVPI